MKHRKDTQPSSPYTPRAPEYVVIVAAADWVKERWPENRFNLWDALNKSKDPETFPEPEADLEAEP
jgi:hypothetical protein